MDSIDFHYDHYYVMIAITSITTTTIISFIRNIIICIL